MTDVKNEAVDPNEINQEAELLRETPTDEVRSSIIEAYGLDEEANSELIDKLVESEIESGKKLSTAIKQKISWRDKANASDKKTEQKPAEKPQPDIQPKGEEFEKILDRKLAEKLEERDLSSLEVSDELKKELKTYATAGGLTLKQAMASDYFKFLKEEETKKAKAEDASIGGKRRAASSKNFSEVKLAEIDISTEEGRKEYEDYKKHRGGI